MWPRSIVLQYTDASGQVPSKRFPRRRIFLLIVCLHAATGEGSLHEHAHIPQVVLPRILQLSASSPLTIGDRRGRCLIISSICKGNCLNRSLFSGSMNVMLILQARLPRICVGQKSSLIALHLYVPSTSKVSVTSLIRIQIPRPF